MDELPLGHGFYVERFPDTKGVVLSYNAHHLALTGVKLDTLITFLQHAREHPNG